MKKDNLFLAAESICKEQGVEEARAFLVRRNIDADTINEMLIALMMGCGFDTHYTDLTDYDTSCTSKEEEEVEEAKAPFSFIRWFINILK